MGLASGFLMEVLLEMTLSLVSIVASKIGHVHGFNKDLKSLQQYLEMIQAVLGDAEDKQSQRPDLKLWLQRLEGIAYKAYELLDELNYEILRGKVNSSSGQLKGKVCSFFFFSKAHVCISFRWKMASRVRGIINELKAINEQANEFGLRSRRETSLLSTSIITGATIERETDSTVAPNVVGREEDESKIVEMLFSSTEKAVSVLPVSGMGGLGKTTLAKLVFNNKRIQAHFNKRIWVCVSDKKFEGKRVFKLILEHLLKKSVQLDNKDTIVQQIRDEVKGKRYLLVLDDLWNDNRGLWHDFFDSLEGLSTMSEGSWCLVTTRKMTTANIVATHDQYRYPLGKLSDKYCWSILTDKATGSGQVPPELIAIKEQLLNRCDGLAIAAKVLGSLLHSQKIEEWSLIVEKKLSDIEDHENNVVQILKLSFDYLPSPSIKKCFAYLSIFEENTEVDRDDLIRLWMAEGFLPSELRGETAMERIGDKYFMILLQSSLLEEARDDKGRVFYKLHNLAHELARIVSENETFVLKDSGTNSRHHVQCRHLALDAFEETAEKILTDLSSVRTLFISSAISDKILPKFRNLHVLKLDDWGSEELPSSIGKLKHMRYLNLSEAPVRTLPESLCKLYNLQTLSIGSSLAGFPKGMSNLISLRHLDYTSNDPTFQMPANMGVLTCLQTLRFFNIGKGKGRGIEELGCLEKLQGKLSIRNLELVKSKEGAIGAKLYKKQNLRELEFCWDSREDPEGMHNCDEVVLEGLEPHPNLRELSVQNFEGKQFPQWSGKLSVLVRLNLINCRSCMQLPTLGDLPCLEYLYISGLKNLSCIGVSFYGLPARRGGSISGRKIFPALKTLILENIQSLIEWKEAQVRPEEAEEVSVHDDVAVFPLLENLIIDRCPQLITTPTHFPALKDFKTMHNDNPSFARRILSEVTGALGLQILKMDGLTCLSDVIDHQQNGKSPIITSLKLQEIPNVKHLWGCGTSLQELRLINCENLEELPENLCEFQSLRFLEISGTKIRQVGPPPSTKMETLQLKSLEEFKIYNCSQLISIAKEILDCCTSLQKLFVCDCPLLVSFPLDFQQTPCLIEIGLYNCPELFNDSNNMPRGFGHLTSLQYLSFGPFIGDSSVELFDWSGLLSCSSTLCDLTLRGMPDMETLLPNQLEHFTFLASLHLRNFGLLEALPDWLGSLVFLEELGLYNCQELQRLPSAPAMSRFTKLRWMYVENCPLLVKNISRSKHPNSEWYKIFEISHIPYVSIDGEWKDADDF